MEQPNYYAIISAEVRYDKNLTAHAKLLYAEITALLNMNGECFATNRYFSKLYSKSIVTISKWIKELIVNGYISTTYTYKEGIKVKDREGIKEKFKDNNTSINNNITYSNNKGRFKKPTIVEIADYCKDRSNGLDAETFFDFYESKDWKVGKNKMKNWKACVRTWEKRNTTKSISKVHMHLSSHMEAKELLKKSRK